ncbi:MAG: TraU family protein, partial [Burkholderiales bacterium]|nr:TraU family protein [Burkholderiales bacterium]
YRGADAIGNPVNFVQGILSGNFGISGSGPGSIPVPLPFELSRWFGDFPAQVAAQWSSIGASYSTDQTTSVRQEIGKYTSALGLVSGVSGTAGQVVNLYNSAMNAYTTGGMLMNAGGVGTVASVGVGGAELMCPPGIMPFGLAFQSDLDSFFWRGLVPLESIYPATWLPGMREVGQGLFQTWGNVWPRTGMIFEQHPVKGAAVLAQRVGDIISHPAQPHIYSMLQVDTNPNYRFFGFQGIKEHDESHTLWQRVFPSPQSQCAIFGSNDSFALMGFGDGQNMNNRGTVWNAWRKQDCCKKPSGRAVFFLGSVP